MTKGDSASDIGAGMTRPAALQLDPARYRAEIDLFDISEQQKEELLVTLWSIMRGFVEFGFTVDVYAALTGDFTSVPDDGDRERGIRSAFNTGDR